MADLPERFLDSIREILKDEYEDFLAGYDEKRRYGLRVNTSKITLEEFERISPFHLKKIPWIDNGYFYQEEDHPAAHPFYAAGLYYLQEPSAMTPASRLSVEPGDRVLDLCAAPGGKATALGAKLQGGVDERVASVDKTAGMGGDSGLLVANDINTARARALLRNLELFGMHNVMVLNEAPYALVPRFPEYFDKIMVDAPCSGEGMFRKNPAVMEAWLEKGPEYFSKLQKEIIVHAADMLSPGGKMFYSTCTFSPLENEAVITHLLKERPDMYVIPMEDYEGFSQGLLHFEEFEFNPECQMTRRIWPHKMSGEGHYLALLQKEGKKPDRVFEQTEETRKRPKKNKKNKKASASRKAGGSGLMTKEQKEALRLFLSSVEEGFWKLDSDHVEIRQDKVYYVPQKNYDGKGMHFLRNGVYLGDLKKKRFEPSEPFALALRRDTFSQTLNLSLEDDRLEKFLRGESFPVTEDDLEGQSKDGWYLVTVEGYPLGFGKLSGKTLKDHYPSGWRKNV